MGRQQAVPQRDRQRVPHRSSRQLGSSARQTVRPSKFPSSRSALPKAPSPKVASSRPAISLVWLMQLVPRNPLALVLTLWLLLMASAAIAVMNMLSLDSVAQRSITSREATTLSANSDSSPPIGYIPQPIRDQSGQRFFSDETGETSAETSETLAPTNFEAQGSPFDLVPTVESTRSRSQSSAHSSNLSYLSLGAIAFSCAAGCLLLSNSLRIRQPVKVMGRRASFHSKPRVTKPALRQIPPAAAPLALQPAKPLRQLPAATSPPAFEVPFEQTALQPTPAPSVPVTVVPTDQSHPLDWDEPSLADSLDLRQRRPLSYWIS